VESVRVPEENGEAPKFIRTGSEENGKGPSLLVPVQKRMGRAQVYSCRFGREWEGHEFTRAVTLFAQRGFSR